MIEDENRDIIASATLLVEHKFLHACGSVGHIEDVVVHDSQRGKKLGIRWVHTRRNKQINQRLIIDIYGKT